MIEVSALNQAVAEWLKEDLGLSDGEVGVNSRGRPPASAGMVYVAVHGGDWSNGMPGSQLDLHVGLSVTVSVKLGHVSMDRWQHVGTVESETGLDMISVRVVKSLHDKYGVIALANEKLDDGDTPYMEPLRFVRSGEPQDRDANWWSGSVTKSQGPLGLSRTMQFTGARNIGRSVH